MNFYAKAVDFTPVMLYFEREEQNNLFCFDSLKVNMCVLPVCLPGIFCE